MKSAAASIAPKAKADMPVFRPQPGPQYTFLQSSADIAIYGGAAGGGKTFALLLAPMYHKDVKDFSAVIFRRNMVQVTNPGGLWDEASKIYPELKARPNLSLREWRFPKGARVRFAHLESEATVYDWQGAQVPLICFDELTHFSRSQFFYMLSRNRSLNPAIKPFVRATCNPDANSFVAELIAWWLDEKTGLPIAERAGVVRWFVRVGDALVWGDSKAELEAQYPEIPPKSFTFIPAKLSDNKALMEADPGYLANLLALTTVERERLLKGNWKIRPAAGLYFQRSWCEMVDAAPADLSVVRYWDLAATPKTEHNDPDWTVGVKMGQDPMGFYYLLDAIRFRADPGTVEKTIKNTAEQDGKQVRIGLPQDPGQAGKSQAQYFVRQLAGYTVSIAAESGDKVTRFGPFSSQSRAGNVKIVRGPWNEDFLTSLEGFPEAAHDDDADGASGAFSMFQNRTDGLIEHYRQAVEKLQADRAGGNGIHVTVSIQGGLNAS